MEYLIKSTFETRDIGSRHIDVCVGLYSESAHKAVTTTERIGFEVSRY